MPERLPFIPGYREVHYVCAVTFELDATGVRRSIWRCICGKEGSAWGPNIKDNDRKIEKELLPKHISAQKNGNWGR